MEFTHLFVFALICMTLVGINGSQSGEDYWKSIWPNTPMPESLSDMLQAGSGTNLPIRGEENKQYWTIFFEHDLYPGNKISLGLHKNYDTLSQPFGAVFRHKKPNEPSEEITQPFGANLWGKKPNEPSEEITQPFGVVLWDKKPNEPSEEITQPFGANLWGKKPNEPSEEITQPFGAVLWGKKPNEPSEEITQPFGAVLWGKKLNEPSEEITQPFRARTWGEKERQSFNNLCRKPSAIGEDKYCALSLKSMIDFAISKLGTNIKVISSSLAQNQDQYVVDEVNKIGTKAVMCHRLNFKDVVFYCHQVNATTAYMVPLVASDGTKAKALTICHHETRGVNPDVLNQVLKVKPGTVPICHFVGNKAIAWIPYRDANESVDRPCVI